MDSDQIAGKFKDVTGRAEAAIGEATGDRDTQASGRARQAEGKVQDLYGQAQEVIGDALGDTTKSAEKVLHSAREAVETGAATLTKEVNARPLIALLIAALVGYVVAALMHGSSNGRR
ncbi:CsbD family protein [Beijerinckia sp. L45]|uniref:CsbD family protein n=1 Tax=Beijerinckia sp. L45 TaxID=1641855 RepID=UPI00131BBD18|nr:CsbD family protein [Beijerinckia sp. L45]